MIKERVGFSENNYGHNICRAPVWIECIKLIIEYSLYEWVWVLKVLKNIPINLMHFLK